MFSSMKEKMRKARLERERAEQALRVEAARAQAMEDERERRLRAIRVISGEVKYRYAVLDVLRTVGYAEFGGNQLIDPDEATRRAISQMQDLAFSIGADAVIHAQFQVLRYALPQRNMMQMPVYETHLFGTAIKVLGPPEDWQEPDERVL